MKIEGSHLKKKKKKKKKKNRCETSRLGAIPCLLSCLSQRRLHGNVKTFIVIVKEMEEEYTRAVKLALEGHNLFISGQKHNFKP